MLIRKILSNWYKSFAFFSLLVLLSACDTTENNTGAVSLNFGPGSSALGKANVDGLVLNEVKILLRDIKLEHEDGEDFESDSESESDDQEENIKVGPFVVNLNVGGVTTDFAVNGIPAGTYDEIKFKIHKLEASETPPDPEFKEGNDSSQRYSVIVKGTYNSIPFVYKSRKSAHQELEFNPPIIIEAGTAVSLTITVDPNSWFYKDGLLLDPSNSSNENDIDNNIEKSFKKAFEDNDDDGEED